MVTSWGDNWQAGEFVRSRTRPTYVKSVWNWHASYSCPGECSEQFLFFCAFSGFLQVSENWKKSGNLSGQGKSGKIYFFWGKVRENAKLVIPDVRFSG